MDAPFDLTTVDALLSTTRAVRRRLDLERDVEEDVLLDCIRLSQQAPTGSNSQQWRWLIVRDPDLRRSLADLYRDGGGEYLRSAAATTEPGQTKRVLNSAVYLAEHLEEVPVHVIPCLKGRLGEGNGLIEWSSTLGSIYPAIWSFQLALRSRGLGSCLTTLHLAKAAEAATLLGLPDDVMQIALLPVAYTKGTDFRPAERGPVERIVHVDRWGEKAG